MKRFGHRGIILGALALGLGGCPETDTDDAVPDGGGNDTSSDTNSDTGSDTDTGPAPFTGVDILVEVDNSGGMGEEQKILATNLFALVNALANPTPDWPYAAVDELRIAVITSDLGVSYGDEGTVPAESATPPALAYYLDKGDNGAFQGIAPDMSELALANDLIPCVENGGQCPEGWECLDELGAPVTGDEIGTCHTSNPVVACPAVGTSFLETTAASPSANIDIQAACLAPQGITGCGFEQQLQSMARALARDDQSSFLVDTHALALILVSDEEDCSMKDAPGLFATPELQEASKLNIGCNVEANESFLFSPSDVYAKYTAAKGDANSVFFLAIAGVPHEGAGASACQGAGDALSDCLEQDEMQLVPYLDTSSTPEIYRFELACSRSEEGAVVTSGVPGRRYVELVQEHFGSNGYVYSICNPDWTPAFRAFAETLASKIATP